MSIAPNSSQDSINSSALNSSIDPPQESLKPHWVIRIWDGSIGIGVLIGALAILSTLPVLNLLCLGYLLAVSGRIAQTGRLRDGFIGLTKAAVLGRVIVFGWLFLWPLRFAASMRDSARLIHPEGNIANIWQIVLIIGLALYAWHMIWACIRGGRVRDFFWPAPVKFFRWIKAPQWNDVRDRLWSRMTGLHLWHFFWLGTRAFIATVLWLVIPVGLMVLAAHLPAGWGALLSFVGGVLLLIVVCYLPFLQVRFATENRWSAMFDLAEARASFRKAPVAFWMALLFTLALALPLYLLKIELPEQRVQWLPSLLFIMFAFPAHVLCGWAVGRSRRRDEDRSRAVKWLMRIAMVPTAAAYTIGVYATQYLSWYGSFSLLEQHAFLVPAPAWFF